MASYFRNSVKSGIGITPVKVLDIASPSRATVIGLSLTNLTEGTVQINVQIEVPTSPSGTITGYYCKNILIPPNTSLRLVNGGEKLILAENNKLYISSDTASSIDALISYVEIV
jgi:hypothetical protein